MYDAGVFDYMSGLQPSERDELEITDVNKSTRLRGGLISMF